MLLSLTFPFFYIRENPNITQQEETRVIVSVIAYNCQRSFGIDYVHLLELVTKHAS